WRHHCVRRVLHLLHRLRGGDLVVLPAEQLPRGARAQPRARQRLNRAALRQAPRAEQAVVAAQSAHRTSEFWAISAAEGAPAGHRIPRLERGVSAQPSTEISFSRSVGVRPTNWRSLPYMYGARLTCAHKRMPCSNIVWVAQRGSNEEARYALRSAPSRPARSGRGDRLPLRG